MNKKTFRQLVLLLLFATVAFFAVSRFERISDAAALFFDGLRPLSIGLVIAFAMNIVLSRIEKLFESRIKRRGSRRALSLAVSYLLLLAALSVILTVIIPQLSISLQTLYAKLPEYSGIVLTVYERAADALGIRDLLDGIMLESFNSARLAIAEYISALGGWALRTGIRFGKGAFEMLLGVIFSIYVLASKETLAAGAMRLTRAVCGEQKAQSIISVASLVGGKFSLFVGGQLLDAAILGGLCMLGMLVIGLPYATLVGLLMAVTALVPIIGAWVGGAVSALIVLMESPVQALIFLIFIVALQQFENNLIYPKIVGDALGISGLWVLVGVTVGGALFGVAGMILGAPAISVIIHYLLIFLDKKDGSLTK